MIKVYKQIVITDYVSITNHYIVLSAHLLNKFHFHKLIVLYIEFKVVG